MSSTFLQRVSGRWEGEEEVFLNPGDDTKIRATAQFENTATLEGDCFASHYHQEVDGQCGIQCLTVFRIGKDKNAAARAVNVLWIPTEGDSLSFQGTLTDDVIRASRIDENDIRHELICDYSKPGKMRNLMRVGAQGQELSTIFDGCYHKAGAVVGSTTWRDLTVTDAERARDFYSAVIGWQASPVDMGGYADYNMIAADGEVTAGVCHARGGNAGLPAAWLIYFTVANVATSIDNAKAHGGTLVVGPKSFGDCKYAVLADPDGAHFAVYEEAPKATNP